MRRDHVEIALLITAAIVVGTVGWSGHVLLLPVAVAFPVLWARARRRSVAALVSAGYFLAASRGLPQGVATFYSSDLWPGLLLWLCASASFVGVHAMLWTKRSRTRAFRYLTVAALMAVPPFGITGWAHPVTAAGVLFPGWGWWGLAAITAGLMGLVTRMWPAVAIAFTGFWLWSAAIWTEAPLPDGWRGVDLELGASLGRDASIQRHRDLIATVKDHASGGVRKIVLPESALGFWTPTVRGLWQQELRASGLTVLAGASVVHASGYDNVLLTITEHRSDIVYRQRMPVPGSMWQPWQVWTRDSGGTRPHFFENPVAQVAGTRIAPLICYEQLIVWPILQSMMHNPDIIVAVGNGWWTAGTTIVATQRASSEAWARLFAKPLVISFDT
jgi:hypothetical protein